MKILDFYFLFWSPLHVEDKIQLTLKRLVPLEVVKMIRIIISSFSQKFV